MFILIETCQKSLATIQVTWTFSNVIDGNIVRLTFIEPIPPITTLKTYGLKIFIGIGTKVMWRCPQYIGTFWVIPNKLTRFRSPNVRVELQSKSAIWGGW